MVTNMKKIGPFEFRYKKQFSGINPFGKCLVSAEQKVGSLINSSWHYSDHWPKEINHDWVKAATSDLETELQYAQERIKQLNLAKKFIEMLDLHE